MDSRSLSPREPAGYARRTAVEWVSRLALGDVTSDELNALRVWLAADPCNQAEFDRARRKWASLGQLQTTKTGRRAAWLPLAACAAACALLIAFVPGMMAHDVSSPIGAVRESTLADGSRLWLDTDSAVDFEQSATGRTLKVVRGRIHIAVAEHPERPLILEAAGYSVRDIGTAFSVDTQNDELRVTVTEGEVEVGRDGHVSRLTAPQAASFRDGAPPAPEQIDMAADKAWRSGRIQLDNMTLATALREIDRYRRGKVWMVDAAPGNKVLSGSIPIDALESGLEALAETAGLRLIRLPLLLIVMPATENNAT